MIAVVDMERFLMVVEVVEGFDSVESGSLFCTEPGSSFPLLRSFLVVAGTDFERIALVSGVLIFARLPELNGSRVMGLKAVKALSSSLITA